MKTIYEYILNKDTKIVKPIFPRTPKISDYIYFFEKNNYKKITLKDNDEYYDIIEKIKNEQHPCYIYKDKPTIFDGSNWKPWIRFKNNFGKKTRIFFLFTSEDGKVIYGNPNNGTHLVGYMEEVGCYTYINFPNYNSFLHTAEKDFKESNETHI